jgi:hypothetical protein
MPLDGAEQEISAGRAVQTQPNLPTVPNHASHLVAFVSFRYAQSKERGRHSLNQKWQTLVKIQFMILSVPLPRIES